MYKCRNIHKGKGGASMINLDIRTCEKCHTLFQYVGYGSEFLCPKCYKEENEMFEKVRKFLRDNPGSNLTKVAEMCEVDSKIIQRWITEGRIELLSDELPALKCRRCGATIYSGRFCNSCKRYMVSQFGNDEKIWDKKYRNPKEDQYESKNEHAKKVALDFLKNQKK